MIDSLSSLLASVPPLYWVVGGAFAAMMLLSRVPILGTAIRIVLWVGMAIMLVSVVAERERLDPYLGGFLSGLAQDGQEVVGDEVRIAMGRDGHFWARVRIGDVERRMLVDSGATITALSTATAEEAGLEVRRAAFPVLIRTANGTIQAQTSEIAELRLGAIVARELPVVVSPAFGGVDVLGMNFLSRLKSWRVEGRTLILAPHHPQPAPPPA